MTNLFNNCIYNYNVFDVFNVLKLLFMGDSNSFCISYIKKNTAMNNLVASRLL